MIKLLNENTPFPEFDDGVFSLRQRAFWNAYKTDTPFFMTWVQTDEKKHITAVITSLSGDITLSLCEKACFEEIEEFIFATGFSSVFYNNRFSYGFSFSPDETGKIMRLEKKLEKSDICFTEPDYKAVFDLILDENEVSFSDWFTDFSFRVRHSSAFIDTLTINGETVCCALCQATDGKSALLGSVKTKAEYRNKGYGTFIVTRLCGFLQQKGLQVFLCRENNKNKEFYSRIGFENCGEWASIKHE